MKLYLNRRKITSSGFTVPSGIIVPLNDTTIPSGWSRFTSSDDLFIIPAGSTYAVAATGGSIGVSITSVLGGEHLGSTNMEVGEDAGSGTCHSSHNNNNGITSLGHTHDITFNYTPGYQNVVLIKADSELPSLPKKSVILTHTLTNPSPRLLSGVFQSNKYLRAANSIAAAGGTTDSIVFSSDGDHGHLPLLHTDTGGGSIPTRQYEITGAHTHSDISNLSVTDAIKKFYLKAWTNASNSFSVEQGMIGMYENVTPPSGWALCDGTSGTPNLTDYFIIFGEDGNVGSYSGNNTIDTTGSSSLDGAHRHLGAWQNSNNNVGVKHEDYVSHSHSCISSGTAYTPPYYALAFIMKV